MSKDNGQRACITMLKQAVRKRMAYGDEYDMEIILDEVREQMLKICIDSDMTNREIQDCLGISVHKLWRLMKKFGMLNRRVQPRKNKIYEDF